MAGAEPKRKRSEDGLLGLLGTYASDEDESDAPASASPKKQRADAGGAAEPSPPREASEEPLVDISAVLAAASEREAAAAAAAAQDAAMAEAEPDAAADERQQEAAAAAAEDAEAFWLPPELAEPPEAQCPPEVQAKVSEYLRKQEETGTTISSALRSLSGYRNPDFLQHCVIYDKIQEYGSCYPPDKFDPHHLPPEDNYKRLAQEWQAFAERQRSERQRSGGIEFSKGGSETLGRGAAAAGLNASSVAANIVAQAKAAAAAGQRASKWDAGKR